MMIFKITEYGLGKKKEHKFNIKTCHGIQWYMDGNFIRVTDHWTGKVLRNINITNWGHCYIEVVEA